jgi:hypothetical protein
VAFAIAALTAQVLGERLSATYLMSVFSPEVRAGLQRANADTESLARSFVLLFRSISIFGLLGLVLGLGVAKLSPQRSAIRWLGILASVLAMTALLAHWRYLEYLRSS